MDVSFEEIDAAIITLCPKGNDNIELYCNSVRTALARAKVDIIGTDTTEKENQKFKNYLVKYEDPYSWFAVDIIYRTLKGIYYYTSDDEDITLFVKQIRVLASIKHFEGTIDDTEAYCKQKNYLNRTVGYRNKEVSNSPIQIILLPNMRPHMNCRY